MHISKFAPTLLLPTVVAASANATPDTQNGVTLIPVEGVSQEAVHLLVRRQLDLGGIVDLIGPLLDLLSSDSLKNINTIITNAASLLNGIDVQQARDLLDVIDGLLGSDAAGGLLGSLEDLLPVPMLP
ncbi:hypothetical protein BJY01DRAFT_229891 [Aspergillus pseudoustus]|uniref:Uncharacterized protein n=1 Tax=Aspergillus pseudoustus TaxID=1810923 RepID=A0ABR4IEG9_9EURO